jgi:transketolase
MNDSCRTWHDLAMGATLDTRSRELRREVIRILGCSGRGHLGSSLSLIEILCVLYDHVLKYDPGNPQWEMRDRCILSKGHGCLAMYATLADKGFFPKEHLDHFCDSGALLGGHPDAGKVPGIEASTGSLGHGLPIGVGMALNARFENTGARVFVVVGDGECNEGSVWEAAMLASKHALHNLTVVVDYNKYQSYDATCVVQDLEPFAEKWRSFGFGVTEVNGHDKKDLMAAFDRLPVERDKPSAIICHTVKGKGVPCAENNLEWHHKSKIDAAEIQRLLACLE